MLLFSKSYQVPGAMLALCALALSGCEVGSSTKAKSPFRAPAANNSGISTGTTAVEVATTFSVSVAVKDKAGYGIPNIVPTVSMSKAVTGSTGVTSGGCVQTDQKGNTTCTLRATLPGTYSVSVLSPIAITAAATVQVDAYPRTLSFTTQPSASTVSAAIIDQQPKVTVLDKAGNPVTLPGTVTLSLTSATSTSGGTAVLAGTKVLAASALGVADFEFSDAAATVANDLAIDLNGTYSFTASLTHATSGVITATSNSFTITSGVATKLLFSISPSTTSPTNVAFSLQPVVIQADASGNPVTTDSSCQVTLTLSGGDAGDQLLGSTLSMTMVSGVANFVGQNLRVQRVGTTPLPLSNYQLTATPTGGCSALTPGASSTFTITLAGLPSQLRLIQPPGTAALNEQWINQPIIGVLDVTGALIAADQTTSIVMSKDAASPAGTLVGSTTIQVVNGVANFAGLKVTGTVAGEAGTYLYDFDGINPGLTITRLNNVSQIVSANGLTPAALKFRIQPQNGRAQGEEMSVIEVKTVDSNGFFCFTDNASQAKLTFAATATAGRMQQPAGFALGGAVPTTDVTGDHNVVNGVASFPNITFTLAGAKQITAIGGTSSPALTSALSDIFAINSFSNTADHLTFTLQPDDAGAGGDWSVQPKIGVFDRFNNLITTDNDTIVTVECVQTTPCSLQGNLQQRVTSGVANFSGHGLRMGTPTTNIRIEATGSPALPVSPTQSNPFNEL